MLGTKYEAVYAGVDSPPVVNMRIPASRNMREYYCTYKRPQPMRVDDQRKSPSEFILSDN